MNDTFYIYALTDPRKKDKEFYIGKGRNPEGRLYEHLSQASGGYKSHKCNVIKAIWEEGLDVGLTTLCSIEGEDKAFELEKKWIAFYGMENLTNMTVGGEGPAGLEHTKEHKKKNSEGLKRWWANSENKKKRSKALKEAATDPAFRKKIGEIMKECQTDPVRKEKYAELLRRRWLDPEYREKMAGVSKEKWADPEYRAMMSEKVSKKLKALWTDPEFRKKRTGENHPFFGKHHSAEARKEMSESRKGKPGPWPKGTKFSEEYKAKMSIASKKVWDDPEYKKKMSEAHKGNRHSEETRQKMIKAQKERRNREKLEVAA